LQPPEAVEAALLRGVQGSRLKGHDEPVELILDDNLLTPSASKRSG
jgi:hypothetical protein